MQKIKVKYERPDSYRLKTLKQGDWIDLAVDEDVEIEYFNESQHVSLGVDIELPEGYEAVIAERSSLHNKFGVDLANGIGVIDNKYNGDHDFWQADLVANRDNVKIPRGSRILQFRIQKSKFADGIEIEEVTHLGNDDRGGFGSTGH